MDIKNTREKLLVEDADMTGSQFHDVCLAGCNIDDVSLKNARFNQISADGAVLHHVDFIGAEFDDIDMTGATVRWIRLPKLTPLETVADEDRRNAIDFEHCSLKGSRFSACSLAHVIISDCDISGLTINGVVIEDLLRDRISAPREE